MKDDERRLLLELARLQDARGRRPPEDQIATTVGTRDGMHPRRAEYLFNKWIDKGWWECGVSARTGWLTPAGLAKAAALSAS